jgi:hypothetical protein
MRILSLAFVLLFIGCSAKTKKESCTFNGQRIPCSSRPFKGTDPLKGTILKAEIDAAISIDYEAHTIEFLENAIGSQSITANGVDIYCGISTQAGEIAHFTSNGVTTTLTLQQKYYPLRRLSGNRDSMNGTWESQSTGKNKKEILTFTIKNESNMRIKKTCTLL